MSLFLPARRATLLMASGPAHEPDRKHLFILLTDPHVYQQGKPCVLMTSVSTVKSGLPHDGSCYLYPGDHPFIRHKSYVSYRHTSIVEVEKLLKGVKERVLVPYPPLDIDLFPRVLKGFEESREVAPKFVDFYWSAAGEQ